MAAWPIREDGERRADPAFPYLHAAARIIRFPWRVHPTTGAATRKSVGLGHVTRRLNVGLGHVITRLSVGLGPIAFGLRIVPRKHDLLILHVRASSGRSDMASMRSAARPRAGSIHPAPGTSWRCVMGDRTWRRSSRSTLLGTFQSRGDRRRIGTRPSEVIREMANGPGGPNALPRSNDCNVGAIFGRNVTQTERAAAAPSSVAGFAAGASSSAPVCLEAQPDLNEHAARVDSARDLGPRRSRRQASQPGEERPGLEHRGVGAGPTPAGR